MELLERDSYLSELNAALLETRSGMGRLALVSGEAGIGKTTLVEQFVQPHRGELRVLWGNCDSYFTPHPFGPLYDLAPHLPGDLAGLLAANAPHVAISTAFLAALNKVPTIAVFEDIHLADEATLDLLRYLGRRLARTPVLLVLTYRDDELGPRHPLRIALGDVAAPALTRRLLLPPLSHRAVRALVGERDLDPAALHDQTGGNPFFVTEVLASPSGGIPHTIRDAVLARAGRLSPAGYAALEAAAVIGLRADPGLLAEIARDDGQAAEECLAAGMLLAQAGMLAFRHELGRQAILQEISPPRRRALNRAVLAALQSSPAAGTDPARLAHHAEGAGDCRAVLEYAPAAARRAAAAGAHREAYAQYALALRCAAELPPAEHALLLESYSQELNMTEQPLEAIRARRQALDIWRGLQNPHKQGESLAHLTILLRNQGDDSAASEANQSAIALLERLPPGRELGMTYRARATLLLAARDCADAIAAGEQALVLAQQAGDAAIPPMAHIAIGSAWLFIDFSRGLEYLKDRLVQAHRTGQERVIANFYGYLGACCAELYELPTAAGFLAEGIAYTAERSLDIMRHIMMAWQALVLIHQGRWGEAGEVTGELLRNPPVAAISRIPALVAIGRLRTRRGDPDAAAPLNEALAMAVRSGTLPHLALVRSARAEAAWLAGDAAGALAEASAVFDLAVSKRHAWYTGELAFWIEQAGGQVELPEWTARPFALQATGDWRASAAEWQRLGCPYAQAWALAAGDPAAQAAALALFERLGAGPAAEALRRRLQAGGAVALPPRPHPATRQNPFGLTGRQVEILALLIAGLSNARIAAELHISPKTTDHHVSAILAQLDVHTRQDAADLARRHPFFKK